jgi:hypothetical protein
MVRLHILTNHNLTLPLDEATHDFCGIFFVTMYVNNYRNLCSIFMLRRK